jgi:carboxymethylenebutenolidase
MLLARYVGVMGLELSNVDLEAGLGGVYGAGEAVDEDSPAVLMVHGVGGVDGFVRDCVERFAGAGFHALALDLYAAAEVSPAADARDELRAWGELGDRDALSRLELGAGWLGKRGDRRSVAVVGAGMGGTLAFLMGCTSRQVAAVASWYGTTLYGELSRLKPAQPLELFLNLDRPYLGIFAESDESLPAGHHQLLAERLEAGHKQHELVHCAGTQHGFMDAGHANYDEASAGEAWERTLGFLKDTL